MFMSWWRVVAPCAALIIPVASSASPIDDKYTSLGGATSFLGAPAGPEGPAPDGGSVRQYAGGTIAFHPGTGARVIYGLIRRRWNELGALQGYLGYPLTDEIDTFDRAGRVSKFQGGELIWRRANNSVSEVKATDLTLDWPFAAGQAWKVIQANAPAAGGSHTGPWAYCWDMILAGKPQTASKGLPFVAAADGRLVHTVETFPSGVKDSNVVIQHLGPGRYASYLHIEPSSYTRRFADSRKGLPQDLPWGQRPMVKSGTVLAEVGDTGARGAHLHFCVTTKPDQHQFAPFESVPVSFRNYSASADNGKSWTFIPLGVPKSGEWVRRETRPGPPAPTINPSASVLNTGTVKGQISAASGPGARGGGLTIRVESAWGEPLAQHAISVPAGSSGPWSYEIVNVPAFNALKIIASSESPWRISGQSVAFEVKAGAAVTIDLKLSEANPK
jgi:hypothetical protein